ncbi:Fe-S-containing protein [Deferribacterales bacterium RsTz2092]
MLLSLINVTNTLMPPLLLVALFLAVIHSEAGHRDLFATSRHHHHSANKHGLFMKIATRRVTLFGIKLALLFAILHTFTRFSLVREYYDLAVMIPLILSELAIATGLLSSRGIRHGAVHIFFLFLAAYYLPDIFMFPVEFASDLDSVFSSAYMLRILGYIIALVVIRWAAYSLYRASVNLSDRAVLVVFLSALVILMFKQLLSLVYILLGQGFLSMDGFIMAMAMLFSSIEGLFFIAIVALGVVASLIALHGMRGRVFNGANPAEVRKKVAASALAARWCRTSCVFLLIGGFFVVGCSYLNNKEVMISPPVAIEAIDGQLIIPLEELEDMHLHRYSYTTANGVQVHFIVIKKPKSGYGVGLDACEVCGIAGYYERSGQIICKMCDVVMNISTIGLAGGCNPVPFKFTIADGKLVIDVDMLIEHEYRFS